MNTSLIQVEGLHKNYGRGDALVKALDGVDVEIMPGEFVAIMGPSGSGKSTLMNILGCLDRPTAGVYYLKGRDVSHLNRNELASIRNQSLGFVFQSFNLLPRLSALDNVMLPMIYQNDSSQNAQQQKQRAMDVLTSVGLADRMHHLPGELSGGQQQRVAIARALVNIPSVILADEPTGNLDSHSSMDILHLLHQLHEQNVTILMVTHAPEVAKHAERIICMLDGKISSDGNGRQSPCAQNKSFVEVRNV